MVHNTVPTSFSSGVFIKEEEYNAQDEKRPIRLSNPKAKSLNAELYSLLTEYRARLNALKGRSAKLSAVELKKLLLSNEINTMSDVSFTSYAKKHAEKYQGATRRVYEYTLRLVDEFFGGKTVLFEDITAGVLHSMDEKWSKTMGVVYIGERAEREAEQFPVHSHVFGSGAGDAGAYVVTHCRITAGHLHRILPEADVDERRHWSERLHYESELGTL